jgi:hypothetical protein
MDARQGLWYEFDMRIFKGALFGPNETIFPSAGMTLLTGLSERLKRSIMESLTKPLARNERDPEDSQPYVELFREAPEGLYVPRYYWRDDIGLEVGPCRVQFDPLDAGDFKHTLAYPPREHQLAVCADLDSLGGADVGIQAPCGFGKTYLAAYAISRVEGRALIIVPNNNKASEWRKEIARFLNLDPAQIGTIQADVCKWREYPVVIAMMKTMSMRDFPPELVKAFAVTIVDEAHLSTASKISRALGKMAGRRIFLTATPGRGVRREVVDLHCGGRWLRPQAETTHCRFEFLPVPVWTRFQELEWEQLSTLIGRDFKYVDVAAKVTAQLLAQGRRVLVVNHQIEPLCRVHAATGEKGGFVIGRESLKNVAKSFPALRQMLESRPESSWPKRADAYMTEVKQHMNPILGIGLTKTQPAGTGMDVANLDGGVIMLPVASPDMVTQLRGRWERPHPDKKPPVIVVLVPDTSDGRARAQTMQASLRRAGHTIFEHPPMTL